MRRSKIVFSIGLLAVVAAACGTDLGTLGGKLSRAADINDGGVVVGTSENAYGQTHAFKLKPGAIMADLGSLSGGSSEATAVNKTGVVVGSSLSRNADGSATSHAVRWNPDNSITDLGTVAGASAAATDINDSGVIVGTLTFNDLDTRAFVWTPANPRFTQLPGIGTPYGSAAAVNNSGQIVGSVIVKAIPNVQAVIWSPRQSRVLTPGSYTATALSRGPGVSGANDINDSGAIVGHWTSALGNPLKAVRWTRDTHAMLQLPAGSLGADAHSINNIGTVVGTDTTFLNGRTISRAWLWVSGAAEVRDLGALGGDRTNAEAVNGAGVAVGSGEKSDHTTHAVRFAGMSSKVR